MFYLILLFSEDYCPVAVGVVFFFVASVSRYSGATSYIKKFAHLVQVTYLFAKMSEIEERLSSINFWWDILQQFSLCVCMCSCLCLFVCVCLFMCLCVRVFVR